jgi:hypothetical protein
MERQNVVSREYKVMLRPNLLTGAEESLLTNGHMLWQDVAEKIGAVALDVVGDFSRIKTRRLISFFDTRDRRLNSAHYIFRERRTADGARGEVTLKFRHPDRFLAQARDMKARTSAEAKTKFEEDIKAPFVSLHSFSTTVAIADAVRFVKLGDLLTLFPDLADRMAGADKDEPLLAVNNFVACEVVLDGAKTQIGKTPQVDAEWALIVWHDQRRNDKNPLAVELSYRYGNKNEEYGGGLTRRACDVFDVIQSRLKRWVDPKPRTKTAVAFQ